MRAHWGRRPKGPVRPGRAANPAHGTGVELGELIQVTYRTRKGRDRELVDYWHRFEGRRPRLVYNDGGLLIEGGEYTITEHGIEG